ncbi:Oncoprotein-induced transcript 3 protein [Desmophyllum pertusum]|uniref:Oncoprotein-induced transcript 3 protein n=1 Tax=Desmophyllum pertusum TaxID=174260 RepID=A0A9W9Z809_9CNID|nr:Oncoprotein-induced transcript 3 protein [Desmophyllum pertusum]
MDKCNRYNTLAEADRKVTYGGGSACDNALTGWYRFVGAAGTKMPTPPPGSQMCGTQAAGWLNGAHPTVAEGQVTRQVCYHYQSNTCFYPNNIGV